MRRDVTPFSLDASIVGASEISRTSSRDAFGKTEVLSADGSQGLMAVAFISTNAMGVIADTGEAPRLFLKGWKALKGKTLAYGQTGVADNIPYERFSFAGNNCFHFHKPMLRSVADEMARYNQILAGYVCVHDGGRESATAIESFLGGIVIPRHAASVYEKDALPVTLLQPIRPLRTRITVVPEYPAS
ncbi:MAG: hypothetical protein HQ513_08920 [Rhodospirillales bacterium]|nr:hypothetical protein [Rhodospirillales bacterium]